MNSHSHVGRVSITYGNKRHAARLKGEEPPLEYKTIDEVIREAKLP